MRKLTHFRQFIMLFLLISFCLFLGGCWDRQEMEERHFVLAAGIDLADEGLKPGQTPSQNRAETFVQPHGKKKYHLSLQILDLTAGGGGEDSGGKKSSPNKTYVISNTGQSLFEMDRDMLGQVNRYLWWEYMQTLIISEAVLKETGLKEIFDWFLRNHEMRWRIKVLVTPGEARPLLEYQPPTGEPGGIYFANIIQNHKKTLHIGGARTDLGFASLSIDNDTDVILPKIVLSNNTVKISQIAAFHKDKFAGYFDDYAVAGMKLINGTEKSALITIPCPDHPDKLCTFELFRHDTRLHPHVDNGNIYFTLDIFMIGNIGEMQCPSNEHDVQDPNYIHTLQTMFAEEVRQCTLYGWQAAQNMGTDILHLNSLLEAHEPAAWEKIKDQWDEIFPQIPLYVSVNITIRGVGEHR